MGTVHGIKQAELVRVIKNMPAYKSDPTTRFRLYFVVPEDKYADFKEQNYLTTNGTKATRLAPELNNVTQWVMKIDTAIRLESS